MSAILDRLTPLGREDKAAQMTAYHKTERPVLGVSNPEIDEAVRAWKGGRSMPEMIEEAEALWQSGVFEARIAAAKLLTKARIREHEPQVWQTITGWVPEFDGWAIADHACKAGERRLMTDLARLDEVAIWTGSDHLWTRRAALVITLPLAKQRHPKPEEAEAREWVLGWAAEFSPDREWFIQKAIGWWLRTLAPHDPGRVRAFLDGPGAALKPFARREATRKLPQGE